MMLVTGISSPPSAPITVLTRRHFTLYGAAALWQPPTFRSQVPLVVVPVSVTTKAGEPVDGLIASDFRLLDSGVARRFELDMERQPLSLVVAIETGEDSKPSLERIRHAGSLIEPLILGTRGEAALLAFDSRVLPIEDFSRDAARIRDRLLTLRLGNTGCALNDALLAASQMLAARDTARRRVVLVISEAKDRSSKTSITDLATELQRNNVCVYAVTYSRFITAWTQKNEQAPPPGTGQTVDLLAFFSVLKQVGQSSSTTPLAELTGGRTFHFVRQGALEQALTRIGEDLHSQYVLSFQPEGVAAGEFHSIRVEVPTHPSAQVRHRAGYWLPGLA